MAATSVKAKFQEPESVLEARERMLALDEDACNIQAQLADFNRTSPDGSRLSVEEYNTWRHGAVYALNKKRMEYRRLKLWVSTREQIISGVIDDVVGANENDPHKLLLLLYQICKRHLDFSSLAPVEQTVMDVAQKYLRSHKA